MGCAREMKRIEGLLSAEASTTDWQRAMAHARTCEGCRRHYDRVVLALRKFEQAPDVSSAELAAIGAAVVVGARPKLLRLPVWVGASGGLATVLGLAALVLILRPDAGDVQSRGAAPSVDASLRAYCVRASPAGVSVVAASSDTGRLSCPVGDSVQFAYTLRGQQPAYVVITGADASGQQHIYVPRPPEQHALKLDPSENERPIPGSVRLSALSPGPVRIKAVVVRAPGLIEQPVAVLSSEPPGDKGQELTLTLEVTP